MANITNNPHYGYHGAVANEAVEGIKHKDKYDMAEAHGHKKYNETHAHVMHHTGASHDEAKHYLDSKHGRHLHGREHDVGYLKKDFKHFKKSYNPEDFTSQHSEEGAEQSEQFVETHIEHLSDKDKIKAIRDAASKGGHVRLRSGHVVKNVQESVPPKKDNSERGDSYAKRGVATVHHKGDFKGRLHHPTEGPVHGYKFNVREHPAQ